MRSQRSLNRQNVIRYTWDRHSRPPPTGALSLLPPEEAPSQKVGFKDLEFWQLLLAAETSPRKSRDLVRDLGSSLFGFEGAFLNSPLLTPGEKKKVSLSDAEACKRAMASGADVLTEDRYPRSLVQSADFVSPALFVQGDSQCLYQPSVGIVGTRNASPYGKACAQKFAEALAQRGVTVVSGGALGIDAAAHRGALSVNGATAAVLACGLDWVYPSVHATLFRELQKNGCVVSQFAFGVRPEDYKFLARNVTIAALSDVLLVIQAPVRSGALTTAHASAEMGREVFVVPSNIDAQDFRGSFNLIRDGATLCYHPDQILESLGIGPAEKKLESNLTGDGDKIVQILGLEPLGTDKIAERTGIGAGDVLSELTMLELDGIVMRQAGGYVLRK